MSLFSKGIPKLLQPMPKKDRFVAEQTCKGLVGVYLEAWQNKDYKKMWECFSKTYQYKIPREKFLSWIEKNSIVALTDFKVGDAAARAMCLVEVEFFFTVFGSDIIKPNRKASLVKEIKPYRPSEKGAWGINGITIYPWIGSHDVAK